MKSMFTAKTIKIESVILLDMAMVLLMYMIPAISHQTSIPLYKLEPMRCVLLLNLLLIGNKRNAYIMALTLPLFSYVVGDHPVLVKALLMTIELTANVFLFDKLLKKIKNCSFTMLISIVVSKVLYYLFKYICVLTGLLSVLDFFSTSLLVQVLVAFALALAFCRYQNRMIIYNFWRKDNHNY